jgi:hypothetical protein
LSPRLSEPKEERDKVIRINSKSYERLLRFGKMGNDFEVVVDRLLDERDECQKLVKQQQKGQRK